MKITIARQCGSGGHEVAEALAEKLNLEIFDKKRFVEEAKKRNVYDENANFLNEKPIDSFLYSIAMSYGATNPRDRYIDFVKELTEQENCSLSEDVRIIFTEMTRTRFRLSACRPEKSDVRDYRRGIRYQRKKP